MIDVMAFCVYGLAESLAMAVLCLALLGAAWKAPRILPVTILLFAGVFVARGLPLTFGAHTVLAIVMLALLVSLVYSIAIGRTLAAASISYIMLIVLETISMPVLRSLTAVDLDAGLWYLVTGLPVVVLLLAAAVLVRRRKLTLFPDRAAGGERGA